MDKIVVRCPKCRYRFDVQVLKGFNVVQCACPRCGAPFDYDLSEVYKNGGFVEKNVPGCGAMSSDETGKIGCDAIQENRQEQGIESLESHEEAKAATASESDAIPVATVPQSMLPGEGVATPMRKVKRHKHRLLWLAVLLFRKHPSLPTITAQVLCDCWILLAQGGLSVADGCRCLTKELDMIAC